MGISRFFIDRPVFAWVIAIIIMLFGVVSILRLSIAQYPKIAPPMVRITTSYPGASAETVENSVTQVIEQSLTGLDGLRYFASTSNNTGFVSIVLTFEPEINPDIAQVQVQNKLQSALRLLPQDVQEQGVRVAKSGDAEILTIGFYTDDDSINYGDLCDLITSKIQDVVARVDGVGDLNVFGAPHSMRIWLNPDQLLNYQLTPLDVRSALTAQNIDVSAGQLGGMPAVAGQQLNAAISAQSILSSPEDFRQIVLKVNPDGSSIHLGDVAKVEVGAQNYNHITRFNGHTAMGLQVMLASGADTLKVVQRVKDTLDELKTALPSKLQIAFPFDAAPFIKISIKNVVQTLAEAVVLVFIVMFLFLQSFRATIIPAVAVPVVLLGTFGVLSIFGFSINVLTMFAMVLAIGLLVDDAIIVVENVMRVMHEENLPPKEATKKSMDQITSALIGITLVLSAVFVPMAFFLGSAGIIYRQFSITLVSAMVLSVIVALVLTPSLCATFLKPGSHVETRKGFLGLFNKGFEYYRAFYKFNASYIIKNAWLFILFYLIFVGYLFALYVDLPKTFLPEEDQGTLSVVALAPSGATASRTSETMLQIEKYFRDESKADTVSDVFTIVGWGGQNFGMAFVRAKDWSLRKELHQNIFALKNESFGFLFSLQDAMVFPSVPAPIRELGRSSGFDLQLVDRNGLGHEALSAASSELLEMAARNPKLQNVRNQVSEDAPEFKILIDTQKAMAMGINISELNQTLQTSWGASYINDFIEAGRIKKVYMQAEAQYRMNPDDFHRWYVRNNKQEMVPFSSFATTRWDFSPPKLERFNGFSSINIQGEPAPGFSTGEVMQEMENMCKQISGGFGVEWVGLSYEEKTAGDLGPSLYLVSILVIFLSLAALYESWTVPFAILLVLPLGIAGAVIGSTLFGMSNNVYFQVGLLTTIGLSAKNAIMIVEFAKTLNEDHGIDLITATMQAALIRFRPIVMTSVAFLLGTLPLAMANGAGAASQQAIGIVVVGGMVGATFLDISFVPMFYVVVRKIFGMKKAVESEGVK